MYILYNPLFWASRRGGGSGGYSWQVTYKNRAGDTTLKQEYVKNKKPASLHEYGWSLSSSSSPEEHLLDKVINNMVVYAGYDGPVCASATNIGSDELGWWRLRYYNTDNSCALYETEYVQDHEDSEHFVGLAFSTSSDGELEIGLNQNIQSDLDLYGPITTYETVDTGLGWRVQSEWMAHTANEKVCTINSRGYYKTNEVPAICTIILAADGGRNWCQPCFISTDSTAISCKADSGGPWTHNYSFEYLGRTWYFNWGDHGMQNPSITTTYPISTDIIVNIHSEEESVASAKEIINRAGVLVPQS